MNLSIEVVNKSTGRSSGLILEEAEEIPSINVKLNDEIEVKGEAAIKDEAVVYLAHQRYGSIQTHGETKPVSGHSFTLKVNETWRGLRFHFFTYTKTDGRWVESPKVAVIVEAR